MEVVRPSQSRTPRRQTEEGRERPARSQGSGQSLQLCVAFMFEQDDANLQRRRGDTRTCPTLLDLWLFFIIRAYLSQAQHLILYERANIEGEPLR